MLTKLGDALINPKTTLTWIMNAAGAPAALVGLLVPFRESGSMLPQVVLGGWVRRFAVRKWIWGRWADRSSRRTMLAGATLASALGVLAFAAAHWLPDELVTPWTWVLGFFVLGIAHGGVRLGRKTHVVDMAEGNQRTDFVATSNTVIGALLLLASALSPLVGVFGPSGMLLLLAGFGFAGVAIGWRLREVQPAQDGG